MRWSEQAGLPVSNWTPPHPSPARWTGTRADPHGPAPALCISEGRNITFWLLICHFFLNKKKLVSWFTAHWLLQRTLDLMVLFLIYLSLLFRHGSLSSLACGSVLATHSHSLRSSKTTSALIGQNSFLLNLISKLLSRSPDRFARFFVTHKYLESRPWKLFGKGLALIPGRWSYHGLTLTRPLAY